MRIPCQVSAEYQLWRVMTRGLLAKRDEFFRRYNRRNMAEIAAGVRRAACRHHVERGEDSLAERRYRKLIFFTGRGVAGVVEGRWLFDIGVGKKAAATDGPRLRYSSQNTASRGLG